MKKFASFFLALGVGFGIFSIVVIICETMAGNNPSGGAIGITTVAGIGLICSIACSNMAKLEQK